MRMSDWSSDVCSSDFLLAELLGELAQPHIGARGQQPRQIGAHGADRRRNRHVVVVEDDDQPRIGRTGIVHRLIGHAGRHGAVADHADDVVRSEEHTSELQSLMRISYAVFCLKKKNTNKIKNSTNTSTQYIQAIKRTRVYILHNTP